MGLFRDLKDFKKAIVDARELQAQARPLVGQEMTLADNFVQGVNNDTSKLSDDDPALEPIQGISLEKYVELCHDTVGLHFPERLTYVESHGVPQGAWMEIASNWNARMFGRPALYKLFNELFLAREGIETGPGKDADP